MRKTLDKHSHYIEINADNRTSHLLFSKAATQLYFHLSYDIYVLREQNSTNMLRFTYKIFFRIDVWILKVNIVRNGESFPNSQSLKESFLISLINSYYIGIIISFAVWNNAHFLDNNSVNDV